MADNTGTAREGILNDLACSAFAEENVPCPAETGTGEETNRQTGRDKSIGEEILDTLGCSASAEVGAPC